MFLVLIFETQFHSAGSSGYSRTDCIAQADLKLSILLPQPPKGMDHMCAPPHLPAFVFLAFVASLEKQLAYTQGLVSATEYSR